ncbi:MAG: hypothetical protein JSW10_09575 [Pseudomonadota bacterium]|nr:MAG: hypothetical protein JSW10_09575 [Pseudomonadota bacterium]
MNTGQSPLSLAVLATLMLALSGLAGAAETPASEPVAGDAAGTQQPADASADAPADSQAAPDAADRESPWADYLFSPLDTPHRVVSRSLETAVSWFDSFFADSKVYRDTTRSYATVSGQVTFREGGETDFDGDFRVKVRLPQARKRWNLIFQSDPRETALTEREEREEIAPVTSSEANEYFTGVEAVIREVELWDIRPTFGVKISAPIDPFAGVRVRRSLTLPKWTFRFEQAVIWFDLAGTVADTLLEFNRPFRERFVFRSTSRARWRDETDKWELGQVFSVFQTLSARRAIAWEAGVYGTSDPTVRAESYGLSIRYRQRVYKKWLFVEAVPNVVFARADDFDATTSLVFRVEAVFGSEYL